jgi:hypothetical protein
VRRRPLALDRLAIRWYGPCRPPLAVLELLVDDEAAVFCVVVGVDLLPVSGEGFEVHLVGARRLSSCCNRSRCLSAGQEYAQGGTVCIPTGVGSSASVHAEPN